MRSIYSTHLAVTTNLIDNPFSKIKFNKIFAIALLGLCAIVFHLVLRYSDNLNWITTVSGWSSLMAIGLAVLFILLLLVGNFLLCYVLGEAWSWGFALGAMIFLAPSFLWYAGKSNTFSSPAIIIFEKLSILNIELKKVVDTKNHQVNMIIPIITYRDGNQDIVAACKQIFPSQALMGASISLLNNRLVLNGIPYGSSIADQQFFDNAEQVLQCIAKQRPEP